MGLVDSEGVEVWLAQALPDCVGEGEALALLPGLHDAVGEANTVGEADTVPLALAGALAAPEADAGAAPALALAGASDAPGDAPVAAL